MSVIKDALSPLEFQEEYLNRHPIESIRAMVRYLDRWILYCETLGGWQAIEKDKNDDFIFYNFGLNPRDLPLYKDLAVKALKAAGGKYRPITREKRVTAFNSKIPDISDIIVSRRISFHQDDFHFSEKYRAYHILENQIEVEEFDRRTKSKKKPAEPLKKWVFPLTPEEFLEKLKGIEIGTWYPWYCYQDLPTTKSVVWEVEFHYKSKYRTLKQGGCCLYPNSFKDFCDLLELNEFFAELLKK